jgi:hypothetical protein
MMGSSGRSSGGGSSSSSKDNGGAAAAIVIIGAAAIAAGASVVSYKAVKANFFGPPDEEELRSRDTSPYYRTITPEPEPVFKTPEPPKMQMPKKVKSFQL